MIFLLLGTYALLASTFTIGKIALMYGKPLFLIGFRMITAGILLLGYRWWVQRETFFIAREDIYAFFSVSLFHIYITFTLEFWALQYVDSAKTTLIYATTPFFAVLFSYLLFKEHLNRRQTLALFIGFSGLLPLLSLNGVIGSFGEFFALSLPEMALLVSVGSACYAWFIIKRLMAKGYGLLHINGLAMLVGGILSMITSWRIEGMFPLPVSAIGPFLGWTLLLVLIGNVLVYNIYGWLLHYYSITFVTFAGFLCPVFGVLFGWFFLGEEITWHYFLGLGLITIGLYVYYREEFYLSKRS